MRHVELYLNLTLGHAFLRYAEGNEMRCAWRGYLDLPPNDEQACEILWAFFQNPIGTMIESRQNPAWIERSRELTRDYRDRSLSAGDVITLDGTDSYAAEIVGWHPVPLLSGDPIIGPEGDVHLREQVDESNDSRLVCPVCGRNDLLEIEDTMIACHNPLCGFKHIGDDPQAVLRLEGEG